MKASLLSLSLFVLVLCTGCSYSEKRKLETTVEQSISEFHEQLNNEQFHDIYIQADAELQSRVSETDFTAQLRAAHERLGKVSGKPIVLSEDDSILRAMRKFLLRKETVATFQNTSCNNGTAIEKFQWEVHEGKAKLADYDLRLLFERGKTYGIAIEKQN